MMKQRFITLNRVRKYNFHAHCLCQYFIIYCISIFKQSGQFRIIFHGQQLVDFWFDDYNASNNSHSIHLIILKHLYTMLIGISGQNAWKHTHTHTYIHTQAQEIIHMQIIEIHSDTISTWHLHNGASCNNHSGVGRLIGIISFAT